MSFLLWVIIAEEMSETENWSSLTDSQKIALKAEGVASLPCEDYQSPLEVHIEIDILNC